MRGGRARAGGPLSGPALLAGVLALAPPALASAGTLPGRAARALPCEADRAADCWQHTARLTRFAPAPGGPGAPLEADVRLAFEDGALLVSVEGLPPGASVELGLSPRAGDDELRHLWPAELGPGLHRLAVEPPLAPGTLRSLRVSARVPTGDGGLAVMPWAPAGEGDPLRAGVLAVLPERGPDFGLTWSGRGRGVSVLAPGASRVRLVAEAPVVPRGGRGVPPPWSVEGEDRVEHAMPPDPGWVRIEAEWRDAGGAVQDIVWRRFWDSGVSSEQGEVRLHPEPRYRESAGIYPWSPRDGARICAPRPEHAHAAALLAEELARFTGARLRVARRGDCAVRFVDLSTLRSQLPEGEAEGPDAFGLRIDRGTVHLGVQGPRSAATAALALADLVGPHGRTPAIALLDAPDVEERVLYHAINLRARPDWTVADHRAFLRRVVARGRYTDLVIAPYDSFVLPGAEDLAAPHSRPTDDLRAIIAEARALGLRVWPGVTGPAHAWWLTGRDGALADDATGEVLDLRDGRTRQTVARSYDALLAVFGGAEATGGRVHLGHDEFVLKAGVRFGDERNPGTAGSPRSVLLAESLRWHMDWARSRGLVPHVWSDTLLEGWNGSREGAHRALDLLSDEDLAGLRVMSWAELGDPWTHLGDRGLDVLRVHTGYVDWKRAGLQDRLGEISGEGLGLFVPAPWAAAGPTPGSRNRFFHTGSVILAGTSAWRSTLVETGSIDATLRDLHLAPAMRPGFQAVGPPGAALVLEGDAAPPVVALPEPPEILPGGFLNFERRDPRIARPDRPVRATVDAPAATLLIAAVIDHRARLPMLRDLRHGDTEAARALGSVRLHAEGAPPVDVPLVYGLDLLEPHAGPWAAPLWRTAGAAAVTSPAAATLGVTNRDRWLWRRDLARPDGLPITRLEVLSTRDGVGVLVAAGQALGEAP